ncbi:MAG TPA: DUF502 domain-containing protein [Flavisolibacter sp.]|nr:DUF502 domain-containing protein [Flavisolibacter sp.]
MLNASDTYLCPMNDIQSSKSEGFQFSKLIQYFLQGLLIIAPVAITLYAVYWIVSSIDNMIPIFTERGTDGKVYIRNYGLGFVVVIAFICFIGYFSSFFIKLKMFNLFDSLMTKTPGVRFIYSTVKDFFEAFAGEKKKFNRPVLANIDDNDVWRVGFITQENTIELGFADYVAVYIPASYSIAGNVYLLPRNRVRPITNINATEAMKFAISGGVTKVEEGENNEQGTSNME